MKRANRTKTSKHEPVLLERTKQAVTHQLMGGLGLLLLTLMVFNTLNLVQAANSGASNLNLTVGAGSLAIVNVGADVQFAAGTAGTASNVVGNLDDLVVSDYRDVTNYDWDVNMYSAPLIGVTDTNFTIANTLLSVHSNNGDFTNINTFNTAKIANDNSGTDLSGNSRFFNAANGRTGAVQIDNIDFQANLSADLDPQAYRGNATLTVIAG